jgi:predicted restriction endonuclease
VVTNGIPLSKTHHAAFDAHLIGIDPDYRLLVSDRLLSHKDGARLSWEDGFSIVSSIRHGAPIPYECDLMRFRHR